MNDTTQDNKIQKDSAVTVATVSANWQIYDVDGHYRAIAEAVRRKYGNRFHPGEIRSTGDVVKFLLRNVDACMEQLRPEPIAV